MFSLIDHQRHRGLHEYAIIQCRWRLAGQGYINSFDMYSVGAWTIYFRVNGGWLITHIFMYRFGGKNILFELQNELLSISTSEYSVITTADADDSFTREHHIFC